MICVLRNVLSNSVFIWGLIRAISELLTVKLSLLMIPYYAIKAENGTGFNLGIVSALYLHKNLELRFIPTLSFAEKTLRYEFENSSVPQKN
jgi:hypothetical protein